MLAFLNPAGTAGGNIYAGLIYPIAIALMSFVIGGLYIRETRHVRIWDEVGGEEESRKEVESGDTSALAG